MTRMHAYTYERYGGPEVLQWRELPRPEPGPGEVLVRIKACALNGADWEIMTGRPFYSRMWGWLRPKIGILGSDIAGEVVACGEGAREFTPGMAVFGDVFEDWGGFAEYAAVPEARMVRIPEGVSFAQAAALPQSGLLALQGTAGLTEGAKVLIVGAGGGVGSFAVMMAHRAAAHATAVDVAEKAAALERMGAARVLDHRRDDFAALGETFDLIIDCVAARPLFTYRRMLAPGGRYFMIGGPFGRALMAGLIGPLVSRFGGRRMGLLMWDRNTADLKRLADMTAKGDLVPEIDSVRPLRDLPAALARLGAGAGTGKLIVEP